MHLSIRVLISAHSSTNPVCDAQPHGIKMNHKQSTCLRLECAPLNNCPETNSLHTNIFPSCFDEMFLQPLRAIRPCGLMDKALVFGTKDCRFESCQGHIFHLGPKAFHFDFHYDLNMSSMNKCHQARTSYLTMFSRLSSISAFLCVALRRNSGTCGLVAMTSASHAEGRQFDPGQVYLT